MNPQFSLVVQLMQKDPKGCIEKYGNNPDFRDFIKEFSNLMGSHFKSLSVSFIIPFSKI